MTTPLFNKLPCACRPPFVDANIEGQINNGLSCDKTPLWHPELFPEVFCDVNRLCEWIKNEFCKIYPGWVVEPGIEQLIVYPEMGLCHPIILSYEHLASAEFYPLTILESAVQRINPDMAEVSYFNPQWLSFSYNHYMQSLNMMSRNELKYSAARLKCRVTIQRRKRDYCSAIVDHMKWVFGELQRMDIETLERTCIKISVFGEDTMLLQRVKSSRRLLLAHIVENYAGVTVASRLRIPEMAEMREEYTTEVGDEPLIALLDGVSSTNQHSALKRLRHSTLMSCFHGIHTSRLSANSPVDSHADIPLIIVTSFRKRCCELEALSNFALREVLLC